jgi:signal transduction histidine kinase
VDEFGQNMKLKLSALSGCYLAALRQHLKRGPQAGLQRALKLGRQAVVLGLGTLALARIHEQALDTLGISDSKVGLIKQAEVFFAEAITPIMKTQRCTPQSKIQLNRLNETLGRRTLELTVTNRRLHRGILRSKRMGAELKKSGEHYARLLKESLQIKEGLRQLTHKILLAQENDRQTLSHQLQDGIAQTLLSIHVRLLTLKTAAQGNAANLTQEIASAQRLVAESVQTINRFARELELHQPAKSERSVTALGGGRMPISPLSRALLTES